MFFDTFNINGQPGTPVAPGFSAPSQGAAPATPKAPFQTTSANRSAVAGVNPAPVQTPAPVQDFATPPSLHSMNDDSIIEGWDDLADGDEGARQAVNIKVFGVGGGGNNAVNRMFLNGEHNADFVVINTDIPILRTSPVPTKVGIGRATTRGHGAGANPEVGKAAAEESIELIKSKLEGVDMLYITAGMGGGTGTGASPVIARAAKEMGILTIAVVTKPFEFEGGARMAVAEDGIAKLRQFVDAVIVVPNERLNALSTKPLGLKEAFKAADEILIKGVQSICSLINDESYINLDFADVTTILRNSGEAHIGIGIASGDDKAMLAADQAINSPLLETSINDADGMIISVTADENVAVNEISDAINKIRKDAAKNVRIIWGLKFDPNMGDNIEITVIATKSGTIQEQAQYNQDAAYDAAQAVNPTVNTIPGGIPMYPTEEPAQAIPLNGAQGARPAATPNGGFSIGVQPPQQGDFGAAPHVAEPPMTNAPRKAAPQRESLMNDQYFDLIKTIASHSRKN